MSVEMSNLNEILLTSDTDKIQTELQIHLQMQIQLIIFQRVDLKVRSSISVECQIQMKSC